MSRKYLLFLLILVLPIAGLLIPRELDSAALTAASVTLSNSRLSYYAKIGVGNTNPGDTTFTVQGSSNADNNTNHLFPNDTINIGSNADSTVGTIIDGTNFAISSGITNQLVVGDAVYATQSGTVTVAFTIANDIPANGYIRVSIPSIATNGNDNAPDTAATTGANGWDLHSIAAADVTVSGGTGCSWNATEVITAAGAGTSHKIDATTTAACTIGNRRA